MLGLSVSAVVAESGDTLPTLANTSQLTVTEDGYVTGIGTNVTAEELVRNFNNRSAIKITAPDGTELSGKQSVPADAAITAGGSEALHALIYCDANRDGKIGMADIILTIRYAIDTNSADICATAVDFNENGRIDTVDIVTLICYIAGWEMLPRRNRRAREGGKRGFRHHDVLRNDDEQDRKKRHRVHRKLLLHRKDGEERARVRSGIHIHRRRQRGHDARRSRPSPMSCRQHARVRALLRVLL